MKKDLSLVDLTNAYNSLEALLIESKGEITEEISNILNLTEEALPTKIDQYQYVLSKLDHSIEFFKERRKLYDDAMKSLERSQDSLLNFIDFAMCSLKTKEIEGHDFTLKLVNNPPSVDVIDEDLIPDTYKTLIQETKLDKKKLLEALKLGLPVEGACLKFSQRVKFNLKKGV